MDNEAAGTSSFQINQTFGHRAVCRSLTTSSKDKTVILFSSKCNSSTLSHKAAGLFAFLSPLYYKLYDEDKCFLPCLHFASAFQARNSTRTHHHPMTLAAVWAHLPKTFPVAEEESFQVHTNTTGQQPEPRGSQFWGLFQFLF